MAKSRAPSILDIISGIQKKNLLPIYYLFGEDFFLLQSTLKTIEIAASSFITSDFDKETFYGDSKSLGDALEFASAFPFGSEKKLIIFRQFEKVKDKKLLKDYAESPIDFTILVILHDGQISSLDSEPYKTLSKNNFIFEAKELKGKNLLKWIIRHIESQNKTISEENAQLLIDISGENRGMLEGQLEKIITFMNSENEITFKHINELSTRLKQYTIFDLQNAIGKKEKDRALEIGYNLLDNGIELIFIVAMLTRYFTGISRIKELNKMNVPDVQAARIVGTHPFYYKDYQKTHTIYSNSDLANAFRALLKADLSLKTTSMNSKNIITILFSELIS
jgi:DNA polymerase-3 subunit delta